MKSSATGLLSPENGPRHRESDVSRQTNTSVQSASDRIDHHQGPPLLLPLDRNGLDASPQYNSHHEHHRHLSDQEQVSRPSKSHKSHQSHKTRKSRNENIVNHLLHPKNLPYSHIYSSPYSHQSNSSNYYPEIGQPTPHNIRNTQNVYNDNDYNNQINYNQDFNNNHHNHNHNFNNNNNNYNNHNNYSNSFHNLNNYHNFNNRNRNHSHSHSEKNHDHNRVRNYNNIYGNYDISHIYDSATASGFRGSKMDGDVDLIDDASSIDARSASARNNVSFKHSSSINNNASCCQNFLSFMCQFLSYLIIFLDLIFLPLVASVFTVILSASRSDVCNNNYYCACGDNLRSSNPCFCNHNFERKDSSSNYDKYTIYTLLFLCVEMIQVPFIFVGLICRRGKFVDLRYVLFCFVLFFYCAKSENSFFILFFILHGPYPCTSIFLFSFCCCWLFLFSACIFFFGEWSCVY